MKYVRAGYKSSSSHFCIQIQDVDFVEDKSILYNETLPALQKCKAEGKLRFIGISGYDLGDALIDSVPNRVHAIL